MYAYIESGATILEAATTDTEWVLRLYYSSRNEVNTTVSFFDEHDISMDVRSICGIGEGLMERDGLSAEQYESLVRAVQRRYFSVPRETALSDLSAEVDLSHQAFSERLRRGDGLLGYSATYR